MIWRDGDVTFFLVEHRTADSPRWVATGLEGFLFGGLAYADRRGPVGDWRRKLIAPQSASSTLWQTYGIHGFEDALDARAVLDELRALPDRRAYEFRVVRRRIVQTTDVVA